MSSVVLVLDTKGLQHSTGGRRKWVGSKIDTPFSGGDFGHQAILGFGCLGNILPFFCGKWKGIQSSKAPPFLAHDRRPAECSSLPGYYFQSFWNHMGMDQYLLIPFLMGWTSIYQLFWCSRGGTWFWHTAIWVFSMGYTPQMGKLKLTRLEWGVTPFFGQTQLRQLRLGKVLVDRRKDTDIMAMFKPSGWATCSTPQWEGGVPCFKSFAWNQCINGCWNPWFPSIFECGWLPEIGHPRIQSFFGSSPPNFPQVGEKKHE